MGYERIPRAVKFLLGLCLAVLVSLKPLEAITGSSASSSEQSTLDCNKKNTAESSRRSKNESLPEKPEASLDENDASISFPARESGYPTQLPRVFVCGFDLWNFRIQLFGDLEFAGRFGEGVASVETDILLQGGLNGPCSKSPDTGFPGQILFVHSEARKGGDAEKHLWNARFFKLGPSEEESPSSMSVVSFGAIYFVSATTQEQRQWILDPNKKRKAVYDSSTAARRAIVYVVNRCGTFRNEVAVEFSEVLPIHQNPKCPPRNDNFVSIPKEDWTGRDLYMENWKLYSKYKYCLVIENTDTRDYITEKLFLAFLGGCLPIYSGTKDVWKIFNRRSFVFYDMHNPHEALDEVKYLERNETAYKEKLDQPILANGKETIEKYLSLADDVGNGVLKRQIRTMLGIDKY